MSNLEELFSKTKSGDVGIIGDPVIHSLSPLMQNIAFQTWIGAFRDRDESTPVYHQFQVERGDLGKSIELARKFKLRGLNVTVPHKIAVCEFLDELDPFAKKVGAVNTIAAASGRLKGYNTDGDGFRRAIERDSDLDMEGKSALVLGVGGAGRVIAYKLLEMNAAKVFIWNRTESKSKSLKTVLGPGATNVFVVGGSLGLAEAMAQADLVVNATSVGLQIQDGLPVENLDFKKGQHVFDVIYHRETKFIQQAKLAGAITLGGESMFLYQGAKAFEIWTAAPAPYDIMRSTLMAALKEGKTT